MSNTFFPGPASPLVTVLRYTLHIYQCLECWSCCWNKYCVQWHNYRLEPGGKPSWKGPTGHCNEPTNQSSQKI